MTSAIHYKFKNTLSKSIDSVIFEGLVLSVVDLKRSIILQKGLAKSSQGPIDFDLMLTNSQTGEDYKDDGFLIPRNSTIVVRRVPANKLKPLTVHAPANVLMNPSAEQLNSATGGLASNKPQSNSSKPVDEDALIQKLMNEPDNNQNLGSMNNMNNRDSYYMSGVGGPRVTLGSKPPPTYKCHRCGNGGHFINFCPTNGDPKFDSKKYLTINTPPILRPQSSRNFLQPIEQPQSLVNTQNFNSTNLNNQPNNYSNNYNYPNSTPQYSGNKSASHLSSVSQTVNPQNDLSRQTVSSNLNNNSNNANANSNSSGGLDRSRFTCPICHKIFTDVVMSPCCATNCCNECFRQSLLADSIPTCPLCQASNVDINQIKPNNKLQRQLEDFLARPPDAPSSDRERDKDRQRPKMNNNNNNNNRRGNSSNNNSNNRRRDHSRDRDWDRDRDRDYPRDYNNNDYGSRPWNGSYEPNSYNNNYNGNYNNNNYNYNNNYNNGVNPNYNNNNNFIPPNSGAVAPIDGSFQAQAQIPLSTSNPADQKVNDGHATNNTIDPQAQVLLAQSQSVSDPSIPNNINSSVSASVTPAPVSQDSINNVPPIPVSLGGYATFMPTQPQSHNQSQSHILNQNSSHSHSVPSHLNHGDPRDPSYYNNNPQAGNWQSPDRRYNDDKYNYNNNNSYYNSNGDNNRRGNNNNNRYNNNRDFDDRRGSSRNRKYNGRGYNNSSHDNPNDIPLGPRNTHSNNNKENNNNNKSGDDDRPSKRSRNDSHESQNSQDKS